MARVKVAHVITKLELGGAQQNTLHTVRHLDPGRFDALLISGRGGMLDREAMASGVPMHFALSLVRPIAPFKDLAALRELINFLREEKPQIVHTHSSKAGMLGRVAAWWVGTPAVVHSFHGFAFHPTQNPFLRWLYIRLERLHAPLAHKLVFVARTNMDAARALRIGKDAQYELIRSGVDIESIRKTPDLPKGARKELGIDEGAPLVVSLGNLKPQKNPLGFVDFADKVLEQVPEARFVFIGDGPLRPKVEDELKRRRLEGKIVFPGWIRDPMSWLKAADVFAMTSLWEGLPRSLVEAMILGRACACFGADGVRDILRPGETGAVVELQDTATLAEETVRMLRDPQRRATFGAAAAASIGEEFDIHGMVRRQEELYTRLLGDGAS